MKKNKPNARALAWKILRLVIEKDVSLSNAFRELPLAQLEPRDIAFVKSLCFGVMRWIYRLQAIADFLLEKPLKQKDLDVSIVLLMGLYQLEYKHGAEHAAVSESVNLLRNTKKRWASGMVNAILRRFQRERDTVISDIDRVPKQQHSHPDWFIQIITAAWPDNWQSILLENNQHPPLTLRLRGSETDNQKILSSLDADEISYDFIPECEQALILRQASNVDQIPGFTQGHITVQDGAAQLAAHILNPQPEERILDACAAPGGKTVHLLDKQAQIAELIAIDNEPKRLERLRSNFRRMHVNAQDILADATQLDSWWDGVPFQKILLDAPCSATGIIRRQPDIKYRRQPDNISLLERVQYQLLNALWSALAMKGRLLYATCSVLPQENHTQIERFLSEHEDAQLIPIEFSHGHTSSFGYQILPGENNMDGFFYALLQKTSN